MADRDLEYECGLVPSTTFPLGSRVVCRHAHAGPGARTHLKEGAVYMVDGYNGDNDLCLKDLNISYDAGRFELVDDMPKSKHESKLDQAARGYGPGLESGKAVMAKGMDAAQEDYHSRKFDQGKSRPDLIPAEALEGLGEVLAYGAAKYAEDSWQLVPDAVKRYHAALLRHMTAIKKHGLQSRDEESGKLHIDHALTNAAFLSHFARCGK